MPVLIPREECMNMVGIMFRIVTLPPEISGKLYLHKMPGRNTDYAADVREIADKEIAVVVRLASDRETALKSALYLADIADGTMPWKELCYPIEDYGIPDDLASFYDFVNKISHSLIDGKHMLMHCGAGIGRTGLVACAVLMKLGHSHDEAAAIVTAAGSGAENTDQRAFLRRISEDPVFLTGS